MARMKRSPKSANAEYQGVANGAAEVWTATLDGCGRSLHDLCARSRDKNRCIRNEESELKSWLEPSLEGPFQSHLFRAAVILTVTKSTLPLQWLCGRFGGVLVLNCTTFGKSVGKKSLDGTVEDNPELAAWLENSRSFLQLRGMIHERMSTPKENNNWDTLTNAVVDWLRIKEWVEGYLEWTGDKAAKLAAPERSTACTDKVESWRIVKHVFGDKKTLLSSTSVLPGELGISKSSVQKWQQPPQDGQAGTANPFDHIEQLTKATGRLDLIRWLCELCGGELRSARSAHPAANDKLWPRICWELIELEYAASRALLDQDVTPAEAKNLRREWDDVRSWMSVFFGKLAIRSNNP